MSSDFIEVEGTVTKVLPNTVFRVQLDNGNEILGNLSNDIRENYTRILVGDRVKVELASYNSAQGCITQLIS
ncbi:MAG: translation initiation factor IF-1 [Leptolyngbya sp. SIO1E4]|nr:translation initiation factor IF-1 [Leptolyngbya sp. SIO1E4]